MAAHVIGRFNFTRAEAGRQRETVSLETVTWL
jgi:hypothetical protein